MVCKCACKRLPAPIIERLDLVLGPCVCHCHQGEAPTRVPEWEERGLVPEDLDTRLVPLLARDISYLLVDESLDELERRIAK